MAVGLLTPGRVHIHQELMQQEEVASEPVLDNMWHFSDYTEDRKARPKRVCSMHKTGKSQPLKSELRCRVQAEDLKMVCIKFGKNNLERALVPLVNIHRMNWKEERIKAKRLTKK